MKILTKEEEEAHYVEVVKGGLIGGTIGVGLGIGGVVFASKRYATFRGLTVPFRAFLVTSTGTFCAIVNAERWSIAHQIAQDPRRNYTDEAARNAQLIHENKTTYEKFMEYGQENRYKIVFISWLASMGLAFAIVSRQPLSTANKVVQARVYAQGLTLAILIASAAFELNDAKQGNSRWQIVMVADPDHPGQKIAKRIHKEEYEGQDLWKDMVATEERRLAAKNAQH